MIFYEIELNGIPTFKIACSVEYESYKNRFHRPVDYLEISLCEQGRIVYKHSDGTEERTDAGDLIPIFSDTECESYAYMGEKQRHTTVAVTVPYTLRRYESESECDVSALENRMKNNCIILIPYHHPMGSAYEEILYSLKKICVYAYSEKPDGRLRALSEWYKLTAKLTDTVYSVLSRTRKNALPSELVYADKAIKIIADNYARRLTVGEIAANLGISEGHLHRIFRKVNGMGITEYINKHRISVAINLISERGLSLKEAAQNTGIDDPAYMCRLFKKVTGITYREYFGDKRENRKPYSDA